MNSESVRREIEARNRTMLEAYGRGDIVGVAAVYADDARLLPPDLPLLTGREAIGQFWESALAMGLRDPMLRTEDVRVSGELAIEIGSGSLTIETADSPPATQTVKYVVVWKRDTSGAWEIDTDIWNSPA